LSALEVDPRPFGARAVLVAPVAHCRPGACRRSDGQVDHPQLAPRCSL